MKHKVYNKEIFTNFANFFVIWDIECTFDSEWNSAIDFIVLCSAVELTRSISIPSLARYCRGGSHRVRCSVNMDQDQSQHWCHHQPTLSHTHWHIPIISTRWAWLRAPPTVVHLVRCCLCSAQHRGGSISFITRPDHRAISLHYKLYHP